LTTLTLPLRLGEMRNKKNLSKQSVQRASVGRALTGSQKSTISVLILQNGAKQSERTFQKRFALNRTISFGRSQSCSLQIPFSSLPDKIDLIEVNSGTCTLLLDPRYQGTVNDGHRIGSVSEFLSPRGSLLHMGSVLEPLKVTLSEGSRVALEFGDFEILIKVRPQKKIVISQKIFTDNAQGGLFNFPELNDPIESWVPFVGMVFAAFVFIPLVVFLLKSQNFKETGMQSLPIEYSREFIHPSHYSVLPYMMREKMDGRDLNALTIEWIGELQRRWNGLNIENDSLLSTLSGFSVGAQQELDLEQLEMKARRAFEDRYQLRLKADLKSPLESERFLSVLSEYSQLLTTVAGGTEGSFYVQLVNRLLLMDKMQEAIKSLEEMEQETLKAMFAKEQIKYQPYQGPHMETLVGARPSEEFSLDFERRQRVAEYAKDAKFTSLRRKFLEWNSNEHEDSHKGTLWIDEKGVLLPSFLATRLALSGESLNNIWTNANYSSFQKAVPDAPLPQAVINLMDVDLLVFGKREELRSCYESGLRRNDKIGGEVKWEIKVSLSGTIQSLRIAKTEIEDKEFLLCLRDRMRSWHFPKPKNGSVTFEYPLRFKKSVKNEKP
jgi:hypothetical protein